MPTLAENLCLACPSGASCPGGADVIPLEGFWTVPMPDIADQRRAAGVAATGIEVGMSFFHVISETVIWVDS